MALIGPIVSNEVFFFVTILALAGGMLLLEWRSRRAPALEGLAGAELRKASWTAQRERLWMAASCAATALFILAITAEFIYAKSTTELSSVPRPFRSSTASSASPWPASTTATCTASPSRSGWRDRAHSSSSASPINPWQQPSTPARSAATQGYYQKGTNVICKNCGSAIFVPTIGHAGGCNPIPLESRVEGDQLVIPAAKLLAGREAVPQF